MTNPKNNLKKVKVDQDGDFFLSPEVGDDNESIFDDEGQLTCDVYQDKDNIVVKSTIAGVEIENIDISVNNDLLTIRGHRESDETIKEEDYYSQECYWGTFSRSIVLPQEVDHNKTKATLKNGILTVTLPKKYKTNSIPIKQLDD
jgi:HSP20 family protein